MNRVFLAVILTVVCISIGHATVAIAQGDTVFVRRDQYFYVTAQRLSGSAGWWATMPFSGPILYQELERTNDSLICLLYYDPEEPGNTGYLGMGGYLCGADTIYVIFSDTGDFNNGYDCTQEGDPVNPVTGNLFHMKSDLFVSGRGLSVNFSRIYASQERENADTAQPAKWTRPLGYGWTHSYNAYMTLDGGIPLNSNWTLRLHDGVGNEYYYTEVSGKYHPDKGQHFLLAHSTGGDTTWTLKGHDGKVYFFKKLNGLGGLARLDSVRDNNGNAVKLSYSGDNLNKITDPTGREFNIACSKGRIDTIFEPPSRSAPYFYYSYLKNGSQYDLRRVEKHTNGQTDTTIVLDRYFYDGRHLMKVHVLPTGGYGDNNGASWDSTKGDRIDYWYYNVMRRVRSEEVVKRDGDSDPSNDTVVYRAHFRYFPHQDTLLLDSTVVFYEERPETVGARNPFSDSAPALPTANYYKKVYGLKTNGTIAWIRTDHPGTSLSFTTTYGSYDYDYNPASVTDPDSKVTNFTYHSYADTTNQTRYLSLPKKIKYATGDSALYYYSSKASNSRFFKVDSSYDGKMRKTNYFYNTQGNLDSIQHYQRTLADGSGSAQNVTTRFSHNSKGNLTEFKNPEGYKTYFHYSPNDTGAYVTEVRVDIRNDGENDSDLVTRYVYNSNQGTLDTMFYHHDYPGDTAKVRYYYDRLNRLSTATAPDTSNEEYTYDKRGNLLEKKITKSGSDYYKIQYQYDSRNRLKKVKEYPNLFASFAFDSTLYAYNRNDAMTEFSNANDGATNTTVNYDYIAGRLYRIRYPDNNKESLGYYSSGQLKFKRDRRDTVIEYLYDARWDLAKKRYFNGWSNYPNTPADSVVFWRDSIGRVDSLLDKFGKIKYKYDGMDRMYELNAFSSKMVKYLYDKVSNRTRMKVCKASDTTRVYLLQEYPTYDEANRLRKTVVTPDTFVFKYWDTGPLRELAYPDGLKEQYWLTKRNSIDSMITYDASASRILHMFTYAYNPLGDRETMNVKITRPSGADTVTGSISYYYDTDRRLASYQPALSIKNEDTPFSFSYDPVGNRLSRVESGTTQYKYDKRNNHLDSTLVTGGNPSNNHEYAFDKSGNIYRKDSMMEQYRAYRFDYENRLVGAKTYQVESGDSVMNDYCALGKRIKRVFYDASASTYDTTRYCYDDMYVVCEFGNLDSLLSKYVYANGLLLARYDSSRARYYYHHDAIGSTIGMTDTLKTVVKSYVYDPFGNIWDSAGTVKNNYMYTGQEFDRSPLWFYNLRARFYDPDIGRFVSEDPELFSISAVKLPQEPGCGGCSARSDAAVTMKYEPMILNGYAYVANNPVNMTDPTGRYSPICVSIAVAFARSQYGKSTELSPDMKHCLYSCEIARICGPFAGWATGVSKEVLDLIGSKTGRWRGHASTDDLATNWTGIKCAFSRDPCGIGLESCLLCCMREVLGRNASGGAH